VPDPANVKPPPIYKSFPREANEATGPPVPPFIPNQFVPSHPATPETGSPPAVENQPPTNKLLPIDDKA